MRVMAGRENESRQMNDRRSYLMMVGSLLIVATIGIFRRSIPLSSPLLAFFRGAIGGISLLIYLRLRGNVSRNAVERKKFFGLVLNGAFLGINWILLFEAFNYTTIAKATLCYYMEPTIVLLLSPLLFGEKLSGRKLLCAAAALAGMVLVSGVISPEGSGAGDLRGVCLGLGAACFYSLVVILNKKIGAVDAWQKTVIQLLSAAAVLLPYLLLNGDFRGVRYDGKLILMLLVVGIIHTGVVYVLYFGSMSGLKAQTISTLSYIDPVAAMIVSAAVLGERLSAVGIIGAVLIIGSALISELDAG